MDTSMEKKTVDVIIPAYKPGKRFLELVQRLQNQTYPVNQIIIMNTEEKYYNQLIYGTDFPEKNQNVRVYHLSKREFDHGKTRNKGAEHSTADYFLCMTQDALPAGTDLVENLIKELEKENVAVSYARQLPDKDSGVVEAFMRNFNYPEESMVKGKADLEKLGIKTFFCSNVCAAYKRSVFDSLGGFINRTIFNEDMIYAAKAVFAGYEISYAADARVIHSHNYSCMEQFHRNFDLGVSQADHPEVFKAVSSESEGIRMVKKTLGYLKKEKQSKYIPGFLVKSGFRFIGYQLGCHYKKLPYKCLLRCSMNPSYWRRYR